jgi:hypothetical protein
MELHEMNDSELTKHWDKVASDLLLGRKITKVRYLTEVESSHMGWSGRPVAMLLDNGIWVFPSSDDEGNEGGSLFTSDDKVQALPLMR